ncbi:MAG: 50S ribosomal protein L15 [Puniceicoccales bacterium]|jgi:large subunit ribosomal protein L15|nr:50S ribosomal protein L15 [Puniceicoccales bacterium]
MKLHTLVREKSSARPRKRVGRGAGSGMGKTSGRGHKGGKARSGYSPSPVSSGIPFYRRLPKRGFDNKRFSQEMAYVNLRDLDRCGEVEVIDRSLLRQKGILSSDAPYKVLGQGEIHRPYKIIADRFSASAKAKILAAGGEAVELVVQETQETQNKIEK